MYRQLLVTSRCSASNETRRDFSTLAGGLKFSAQSQWLRFMSWNSSYLSSACAGTIRCRLHRGTTWYNLSVDWQWHFFVQKKNICCFSRIQKIDVWHVSFKHHDRCQRSSRRSASNVHRILYCLMESHRILLLPARISTVKQPSCSSAPLGCQSAPRQSADVLSLKWMVGRMFQYNRSWTWSRWVVLFFCCTCCCCCCCDEVLMIDMFIALHVPSGNLT